MKFFIYISLLILILAPFISIDCKRNNKKSKKNKHPGLMQRVPKLSSSPPKVVTNVSRPFSKSVSVARPTPTIISSPTNFSGTPKGPGVGIVRSGFVSRPFYLVRRYAIIRLKLTECPAEFSSNLLVIKRDDLCPDVCTRSFCIQIQDVCCIYNDDILELI